VNDSKNNPKSFPPDDFSATTPNIKMPKHELPDYSSEPANDWEKTNYNYSPKDLGTDQWNKPAYNTPPQPQNPPTNYNSPYPPNQPPQDFNKTYMPGNQPPASNQPKEVDWGMTQANIKLPSNQPVDQTQTRQGNYGGQQQPEYGATTPLIRQHRHRKKNRMKRKAGFPAGFGRLADYLRFSFSPSSLLSARIFYYLLNAALMLLSPECLITARFALTVRLLK
jgi:hypothetical protein